MPGLPFVSVLVPVRNEERFIGRCLTSLLASDYPAECFEILVIDGMSTDDTPAIVAAIAHQHARVKVLANPQRLQGCAMNLGIERARGEVIVRIDGHVEVPPDFLRLSIETLLEHPECACAGGVIENVSETSEGEAISLAMSSPFGVGDAHFRTGHWEGYVDTVAFGAYRKATLYEVGLFDTSLARNEDNDLNFRIRQAGYRIWCSPKIRSKYYVRSSYVKLFRQYYQYGYWKVYVNKKRKAISSLRQLAPILLVLTLGVLGLAALISTQARVAFAALLVLYAVGAAFAATRLTQKPRVALQVVGAFAVLHFSYGLGYLEGILTFLVLRRSPRAQHADLTR